MQREAMTDTAAIEPAPEFDANPAAELTEISETEALIEAEPSPIGQLVDDFKAAAKLKDADVSKAKMHAAFEELVLATQANTYTLAFRLTGDEEVAREVSQEAYLRAYRGLPRFRGDAQFATWLFRITTNVAFTELQRRTRHRHDSLDTDDGGTTETEDTRSMSPEDHAINSELSAELQEALNKLPPGLRAVVVLRDIYDLPHEGIARELDISESTAKVRLHRARKKLRELLHPSKTDESIEPSEVTPIGVTALQSEVLLEGTA